MTTTASRPSPPHASEFDTKGKFRPLVTLFLGALMAVALAVLVFRIIPWVAPRFIPGLVYLFTTNPLVTLHVVVTNQLFMLSLACLVPPIFGVTVGFHRGETHTAFKWDKPWQLPVRLFFLTLGHMAVQGDLITWAERHRPHHAYTDTVADSHTPMRYSRTNRYGVRVPTVKGFFYAHTGTYFYCHKLPPPPWGDRAKAWATTQEARREFWVGDLEKDPLLRAMRWLWAPLTVLRFAIPFAIAGWDGLLIAGFFTAVLMLNITWCTNSVAHVWGTFMDDARSRKIAGSSRNVFFWLLQWTISGGESWHHFHHRLQTCAAHGWRWFQFDFSKYIIWVLEKLRLVHDVHWLRDQRARLLAEACIVAHSKATVDPPLA